MLYIDLLLVLVVAFLVIFGGKYAQAFRDQFRGGPRPPSHPLPADDSRILNRRRRRSSDAY
jgi:hypothetical protein